MQLTRAIRTIWSGFLLLLLLVPVWAFAPVQAQESFDVLVFSRTEGFRHASIPDGIQALKALAEEHNFTVTATEDASAFTRSNLAGYDVVVFLNTTGNVLDADQEDAFETYIQNSGGYVGVHSATDTEYKWDWYGGLVGAYFNGHPEVQEAEVKVVDPSHPSSRSLPARWIRTDEWYNFDQNPRGDVHVIASVEEKSYEGGEMGHDHPVTWAQEYDGGRAWYTAMGHTRASYQEELFIEHLLGGLRWAAGVVDGDVGATQTGSFEKIVLDDRITNPVELDIAPDGRVFFVERDGAVKVWDPETHSTTLAGFLDVWRENEDGVLGVQLAPDFAQSSYIYVYYSPYEGEPRNMLSRFTVVGDTLDMPSEEVLLEVPVQRAECCHTGGSMAFDRQGNLYLSTGDNTNPFGSDGFSPLDERPGRKPWDAQRSAGNTMDLRGKILRIHPTDDGGYTIPDGNLFPEGVRGRREIYVMGSRNPYRIALDRDTGWLYWGDVGPDAGAPKEERGPAGHDEINQAREAGYFGWPYFVADNKAYHDYNFETEESGPAFDPEGPMNESINNTGVRELPPARSAFIWYTYAQSDSFPELGAGGRTAMAGPVYHYEEDSVGERGMPPYFDESVFIYEWARNWIKEVKLDADGEVLDIHPFVSEMMFVRPMDMEVGPEGRLYVLEWGGNFWGNSREARLVRLDYYGSPNHAPVADIQLTPNAGPAPLSVEMQATVPASLPDTAQLNYAWDVGADGQIESNALHYTHRFAECGEHQIRLTVTDQDGRSRTATDVVTVQGQAPEIEFAWPPEGGVYAYDESVPYRIESVDGASLDRSEVAVTALLGHNTHEHVQKRQQAAEGSFAVTPDTSHNPYLIDRYVALEARYSASGAESQAVRTERVQLQPSRKQAEHFSANHEGEVQIEGDPRAQRLEGYVGMADGSHLMYTPFNLTGIEGISLRVAPENPGQIQVRMDAPDGPVVATAAIDTLHLPRARASDEDDGSPAWETQYVPISPVTETHDLYIVARGATDERIALLDWIGFHGKGISGRAGQ